VSAWEPAQPIEVFIAGLVEREAVTPNGDQRYGRPSGRLYFMRDAHG
jgi:hypothetical protein